MTEAELQKQIMAHLNKIGVMAWRNNVGCFAGTYKGKKRFVRFGFKGAGDIFGITQKGQFISIEVKSKGKRPTPDQKAWIDIVLAQGGWACWTDSWESWIAVCKSMYWPI